MDASPTSIYDPDIPGRHFSNAIIIWKIKNISFVFSPGMDLKIPSEIITLHGPITTYWRLYFEVSHEKESIVLSLEMLPSKSSVRKVKVKWESYCMDVDGEGFKKERSHSFVPCDKVVVKIFKLRELEKTFSTKSSDNLEIKCHMLVDFGFRPHFKKPAIEGVAALTRDFEKLPKRFLYHDIVADVSDREFYLHRAMLCHRGEKLAELIKNPSMNKTVIFPFRNVKAAEAVFTYLYTGDLSFITANPSVTICEYIDRLAVSEMQNIYPKESTNLTTEIVGQEFSFSWIIEDFKGLKEPLKSPEFHEKRMTSRWQLCMYPTISENDMRKRVESIRITATVLKCDYPIHVCLEFSVVSVEQRLIPRKVQGRVSAGSELEVSFFESVDEVLECIRESSFSLLFKIRVATDNVLSSIETTQFKALPVSADQSYANLTSSLANVRRSFHHSDAILEVEGKIFKIHKFLMAARSSLFEEIFRRHSTTNTIKLPADQGKCMEQFISFLYLGNVTESDAANLMELWDMGESSNIKSLQNLCTALLLMNIANENVLQILIWADNRCNQKLVVAANCHVLKNYEKVIKGPYWYCFCTIAPHMSTYFKNVARKMNTYDSDLNEKCKLSSLERAYLKNEV